jgi:hypothetical protein
MPNHCISSLVITGKPKKLHKLLKQVEITQSEATEAHDPTTFSCHKIIPRPVSEDDNWYNWNSTNWGSKWDFCDVEWISRDWENGEVMLEFWTAWSPVPDVLQKLSEQNPDVEMTYRFHDEGGGFYGTYSFSEGMIGVDEEGSDFTCDVKTRYGWGEEHHYCNDCGEYFMCPDPTLEGNLPEEVCSDCKASLEATDKDLWEEEALVN